MANKYHLGLLILLIGTEAQLASAADDPATIVLPYSSAGSKTLGDSININFPEDALGRCVDYTSNDVKWDTAGAISSNGTVGILSTSDSEKNDVDLDLGLQTSSKIKSGGFSANSSYDLSYHTNDFRDAEDRSVTIAFKAYADYGRHMIENYNAKQGLPSSTSDLTAFRQQCGTHFIRGQRRASELTILVRITTSSRAGKDVLDTSLNSTFGGGATINGITGEGSTTMKAAYKSIIEFARASGSVQIDYRALGGSGIQAAGESAKLVDPSDLGKLADTISQVSSLFNQDNSSVTGYVLQSDTSLGAPDTVFDVERVRKIGSLTRALIEADAASDRYDEVKTKAPAVFAQYFSSQADGLLALKAALIDKIKTCASGGACAGFDGDVLDDYIFLEDMFTPAHVTLSCQYQPANTVVANGPTVAGAPQVLESMSVNVEGQIHHYNAIDFSSLKLSRLRSDYSVEDITPKFSGFAFSQPQTNGQRRAFGTIYSENVKPSDVVTFDSVRNAYSVDTIELERRRDNFLGSAFSLVAPGPAGFKASYTVGYLPRDNCPITK